MNKGKGLLGGIMRRPRRAEAKVTTNYDEAHGWEDDMLFRAFHLEVHSTRWQDPVVMDFMKIEEDFNYFTDCTRLLEFARHPQRTYEEISREFLATFHFCHDKGKTRTRLPSSKPSFDVKFRMFGRRYSMTLNEFCKALHLPNEGNWEEVPSDSDVELQEFWKTISVDEDGLIHRAKLSQIQHPGLRYFALFLVKGFLPRKNSTACIGPVLHLLKCAKEGVASRYNLGVMLARSLSY